MLSRLFNLGGDFDRSASPDEQFFATIRRPLLALAIICFVVFVLFSERRILWPDSEIDQFRSVEYAVEQREYPFVDAVRTPPLLGMLSHLLANASGAGDYVPVSVPNWAVRLPSIAAAVVTVFLLFWIGEMLFSRRAAFLGAAISALCLGMFRHARWPQHEMLLTCFVVAAIGCWLRSLRGDKHALVFLYLFYLAMALAVQSGGAMGLLIPVLVILLWRRRLHGSAPKIVHLLGLMTVILLLVVRAFADGGPITSSLGFLWQAHVPHFNWQTFGQFFSLAVVDYLPWLPLIPCALWLRMDAPEGIRPWRNFVAAWSFIAAAASLITLGSRSNLLIVAWPPAALLIGVMFDRIGSPIPRAIWVSMIASALSAILVGFLIEVQRNAVIGRIDNLFGVELAEVVTWPAQWRIVAAPLLAGGILALTAAIKRRPFAFFVNLAFSVLLSAAFAVLFLLSQEVPFS